MANLVPGAPGLFDNGASFHDSNVAIMNKTEDAWPIGPVPNQTFIPDLPEEVTSATENDGRDVTAPQPSFLDIRSLGGRSIVKKSLPHEETQPARKRKADFQIDSCKSLEFKSTEKPELSVKGPTTGPTAQEKGRASKPTDYKNLLKTGTEEASLHKRSINDQANTPYRGSKMREERDKHLTMGLKATRQTAGETNVKFGPTATQKPPPPQITESRRNHFLQEKIQREVDKLKLNIAKLDTSRRNASTSVGTDHAWIEDVMRDITQKGEEIKVQSVSIRTTITTGCDPRTSGSNLKQKHQVRKTTPETQEKSRDYLTPITNSPTWRLSHQNRTSNTLLRLQMEHFPTPADTISTASVLPKPPVSPVSASVITSPRMSRGGKKGRLSKSPTSMSTPLHPISPLYRNSPKEKADRSAVESVPQKNHLIQATAPIEERGEETAAWTAGPVEVSQDPLQNQAKKEQVNPSESAEIISVMEQYPGIYPRHLDDEGGIGVPFEHRIRSLITIPTLCQCLWKLWTALKVVGNFTEGFIRIYLTFVGPVFDSSSEHWRRAANNEITAQDTVAAFLAIPLCLLIAILIPYGTYLLTWAWTYLGDFLHHLIDELYDMPGC